MRPRRKRPKNDELPELARVREHLWALQQAWFAAANERLEADRAEQRLLARELEDWKRGMRESGRGGEIYKRKPLEPRSAERVEAERVLAEVTEREREALKRYQEASEESWERRMEFRDCTDEDERRFVKLRGWPTDRYMNAVRENPKDLAYVKGTAEDLAAWEAARAQGRTASSDPARLTAEDGSR